VFGTSTTYKLPKPPHHFCWKRNKKKEETRKKREERKKEKKKKEKKKIKKKKYVRTSGLGLLLSMDGTLRKRVKSTTYKEFLQKTHKTRNLSARQQFLAPAQICSPEM